MKRAAQIFAALAALAAARTAAAHPVPFSYLDVRIEERALELSLVVHAFDVGRALGVPQERLLDPAEERGATIIALLGPRLSVTVDGRASSCAWSAPEVLAERQALRLQCRADLRAAPRSLTIRAALFPDDATHQTFVNTYRGGALAGQTLLDREHPASELVARPGATVQKFLPEGIRHILIGPDHLLFLVSLLLLGGSWRRLLAIVTAFTAAHSVTLSLAALDVVSVPARVIEPAIALSIVCAGLDNLLAKGGRDVRPWIALGFGFIHGFGFAGVLREVGLPRGALGWSLFSFNVGVELGQLAVVAAVAGALAALRARSEGAFRRLATVGSVAAVAAGGFWFIERVLFPGGI